MQPKAGIAASLAAEKQMRAVSFSALKKDFSNFFAVWKTVSQFAHFTA
jgi:hypothetical protein